jgi:hypothetical protein
VEVSHHKDLLAGEVQPHDMRQLAFIEVTTHSLSNVCFQLSEVICLGEDRLAQRAGGVAAFRRFFDHENEFIHRLILLCSPHPPARAGEEAAGVLGAENGLALFHRHPEYVAGRDCERCAALVGQVSMRLRRSGQQENRDQ